MAEVRRRVRGGQPHRFTVGVTEQRVAHVNDRRASMSLIADPANTGTLYIAYDDPDVTTTGNRQGIPLSAGDIITEEPPAVFTGEVWAIGSAAGQVLIVVDTEERGPVEG